MKQLLFVLFALFFSITSKAQHAFGLDLGIGVKGGLNAIKIKGDGLNGTFNTDPHLGAFAYLNKRRVGVQVEAVWTQNVVTTDSSFYGIYKQYFNRIEDSLKSGSFKFSTVSIPLLINFKFNQKVWIQFGPQYSSSVNTVDKNNLLKSGTEIIRKNNYNFITGLWFQFGGKAPVLRFNAGARMIFSLNNMNGMNNYEVWTNQLFQLHLGISY